MNKSVEEMQVRRKLIVELRDKFYKGEPELTNEDYDKILKDYRNDLNSSDLKNEGLNVHVFVIASVLEISRNKIIGYQREYYLNQKNVISDEEFDSKVRKYNEFLKNYGLSSHPFYRIPIGNVSDKFNKVEHDSPMLSIDNAFDEDDVGKFLNKINGSSIVIQEKIDGLSISLIYEYGYLTSASTRGDGLVGEDVTQNVFGNINGIETFYEKLKCYRKFEVRGEIYISHNNFRILNEERKELNLSQFSNPRNTASGSLRNLDPDITKSRRLSFLAFFDPNSEVDEDKSMKFLENIGFPVVGSLLLEKPEDVSTLTNILKERDSLRGEMDYDIDGLVYKVNRKSEQIVLGEDSNSPNWCISHKFRSKKSHSTLRSVDWQVGRTGAITPVARIDPIHVGGVEISSVTLHNIEEIKRLNLHIGDVVEVERSGDVIPKIISASNEIIRSSQNEIIHPTECPECQSKISNLNSNGDHGVIYRCMGNSICPPQIIGSLEHFCSKECFNIEGFSHKKIETLHEMGILDRSFDLYNLRDYPEEIKCLEGWGERSFIKLMSEIEKSKEVSLERFIYSIGLRMVGERNSKILSKYFISLDRFMCFMQLDDKREILKLDGIGDSLIKELNSFMVYLENFKNLQDLTSVINVLDHEDKKVNSSLSHLNVVFTGKLYGYTRKVAKESAEKMGITVLSGITKNVDILIAGEKSGSKLTNAQKMGIRVLSESEWDKVLSGEFKI